MNVIDLEHAAQLELEYQYTMEMYYEQPYVSHGRTLRRRHGRRLTKLAVVHVCRTIVEEGFCEISADALSKRIGRRYHRLRRIGGIQHHVRPKLTVRCMEKLIAFIRGIPRDTCYMDALEGVLICCIEYHESGLERWFRLTAPYPWDRLAKPTWDRVING